MKLPIITDLHFGARNDNKIIQENQLQFFDNILFPYLKKSKTKNLICLGDLFDRRKFISFTTLDLFKKTFFDKLKKFNINLYTLIGNHDTALKNTNDINSPNLILKEYDNIKIINEPVEIEFDNYKFGFVPWINKENEKECYQFLHQSNAKVLCGHLEVSGFEVMQGITSRNGMSTKLFDNFNQVFSGHYHIKNTEGKIKYFGSPYEMNWGDYNSPRGFHIFDTQTENLEFVQNHYNLYYKINFGNIENIQDYDYKKYKNKIIKIYTDSSKDSKDKFDYFMDNLNKNNPYNVSIIDSAVYIQDYNEEDEIESKSTLELLDEHIENSEITLDKDKLKAIINRLYIDSNSIKE